ncbi:MAG: ABC transporter permease [Alphaproteobacteria bacterium]|nr:ABC transporter permease [Alphaproteobacteria bacterium]
MSATALEPTVTRARSDFWPKFRRNRNAVAGSIIVSFVVLVAIFARLIAPYEYDETDILFTWAHPSAEHPLGTDALGRDILSRLIVGAQVSLTVAFAVLGITLTIGIMMGMIAGYFGGRLDAAIMRTVDIIFAFPDIIFAILLASVMGPGIITVIVSLSVVWWPGVARLTRSLVLQLRTELYVDAAIASGTPPFTILLRHFLPNIVAPLIVRASIGVGFIIMAEATLSFLGIGVQEPRPSWGGMIRDGIVSLRTEPYLALSASTALGLTIIGFNLFGDGLRDILDPRIKDR